MTRINILCFFLTLYTTAPLMGQQSLPVLEEEVLAFVSDEYVMPGEHLWVEARVSFHGKVTPSKVLYLEIINREGVPVLQEMAKIEEGKAMAYLLINDKLPSDYYLLRVYTKVSPYHSPEKGIHHQVIGIINPALPPKAPLPSNRPQAPIGNEQAFPFDGIADGEVFGTNEEVTLSLEDRHANDFTVAITYVGDLPEITPINTSNLYDVDDTQPVPQPEIFGHLIQGRALNFPIDTTETYYLSAHGISSKLMISKPLVDGRLFFESADFQHYDFVIVQAENQESQLDFVLESPFWQVQPKASFQLPALQLPETLLPTLQDRLLASQTGNYYFPALPAAPDTLPPFLVEDYTYLLDDYNRFDDMATVIREYVPTVLVRRENRQTIFKNVNKPAAVVFQRNPLILIDAMPVFDSDAFAQFNPAGIRKMEIVNRQFYLDHKEFEGVINLTSFDNDFGKFDLPKNALFIAYKGIQIPKNHEGTWVKNDDKRLADFRALRLWRALSNETKWTLETGRLTGKFKIRYRDWKLPSTHTKSRTFVVQ
ncbi:MAG: hypothetical protein JJU34_12980 [Lunatimonas sp.]|uniref:hypothetical protein n=1 Tax=Lunatimonas sp. TaxID=2060141 RepID=UPI00263B4B78|nr:hypothetical protein [Lunatimonas sp.]MCC5938186.1 hypothetical protein [Lunatimonas sp.]